jgi:hypothetical protein
LSASKHTKYLNNYKCKNKFFQAFIKHKVERITSMCSKLLIDSYGKCNYELMEELGSRGFSVGPGEQDRFGWLSAILYTKKGSIVFG